uniref:Uncharacterized protein n=1 Tax=Peronospora matthiolae TaxID=2874970 RepID=A0AAV1UNA1_9STRA
MHALLESAIVADVRLERKLRYDCAKLKARGHLWGVSRSRYTSAASEAASSRQSFDKNSPALTTTSEKRYARQDELGRGAQKRQRRMCSLAEGEPYTPIVFQTQGTHTTSADIDSDHHDDVVKIPVPHGTVSSLAYQATPVSVVVSAEGHAELVKKAEDLRETLRQTQNALVEARFRLATLEGNRAHLQMMESRQTRVETQLDLLIRMQNPVATPMYAAQAPSSQHGTGPGMA